MKDLYEVLRQKEQEYKRLAKELEALRITAALLAEDKTDGSSDATKVTVGASNTTPGPRAVTTSEATGARNGSWEEAPTRWP